ncbi:MAG: PqqD family peptide modification chaperone, partial [Acetobacteraceae bacterium]|nr:PqqD family peptide modification chaperone [Acetobacteraceae bacterium]
MEGADPAGVYRLAPGTKLVNLKRGGALIDPERARWTRINATGRMIVELCDGKRRADDVAQELASSHGVPADIVKEWTVRFLTELLRGQFIRDVTSPPLPALGAPADQRLDILYLHVTSRCNMACPYCYARAGEEHEPDLNAETLERVVREAAQLGATKLALSGGEPLLRDDLERIAGAGKAAGLKVQLLTNGCLLTRERAERLIPVLDLVQVSIDGWDEESNSRTRGKGTFTAATGALAVLREVGMKDLIVAATPVFSDNEGIGRLVEMAWSSGARLLRLNQLVPAGRAAGLVQGHQADLVGRADAVYSAYRQLHQRLTRQRRELHFTVKVAGDPLQEMMAMNRKVSCGVGVSTISVAADGTVYPCAALHRSELALGNIG